MKKKYIKYTELFDHTVRLGIERLYKDSFRRNWYISGVSRLGDSWIIKWERKP